MISVRAWAICEGIDDGIGIPEMLKIEPVFQRITHESGQMIADGLRVQKAKCRSASSNLFICDVLPAIFPVQAPSIMKLLFRLIAVYRFTLMNRESVFELHIHKRGFDEYDDFLA